MGDAETPQFFSELSVGKTMDEVLARENCAEDISVQGGKWIERANGTACRRHAPCGESVELAHSCRWVCNFGKGIQVALVAPD